MEEQYLIDGILNRDKVVFDFIFQYYYSGLCAYCEKIVKDQQSSEDIVQDLFVTLWTNHKKLKIYSSLKNYLFVATKNRAFDFLKKEKRQNNRIALHNKGKEPLKNLSSCWFAEAELRATIDKSLKKLPPRCREIFKLSRIDEMKNQDIADKLNISKRTVELQISRALRQLRIDLGEYLPMYIIIYLFDM